jgi:aminoglycoside 6'-N-acetyltransferase
MLKGLTVDLRAAEREDLELLARWYSDSDFQGAWDYFPEQLSREALDRELFGPREPERASTSFIIQRKDGTPVGVITHFRVHPHGWTEIGYALVPEERGKGYGTEAIRIMTDYLFLSKAIERVQALTAEGNTASRRALEKAGFLREGIIRRSTFVRGGWLDDCIYGVTREGWGKPRVLKGP